MISSSWFSLVESRIAELGTRFGTRFDGCNNEAMKSQAAPAPKAGSPTKRELKSGLPGTPEEQRRDLRAAMKRHAETLRRLAQ
jgi:hypothetical protein